MIFRRLALMGAAVLAFACAAPAFAQPAAATKVSKDANGNTFNLAGQVDAAGAFHYRDVLEGLLVDGVTPKAWYVDANGVGHISLDALSSTAFPAGLPVAQADQQNTVTGFNIGTVGNASAIPLTNGRGAVGLSTSGITGSGATLQVQAQNYPSGPWAGVACILPQTGQNLSSFSSDVTCRVNAAGHDSLRLVVLTASTSGSATMSYGWTATVGDGVVTEINSSQIAANTAQGGSGTLAAIGTPATNGTALTAGAKGVELWLNANDTVTLAIEPAGVCGVSAPSYTATEQGGSGGTVIGVGIAPSANLVACVTAKTGAPGSRPY